MSKKHKSELDISEIGRTSRAVAFLTVIMMFCVIVFSFIMAWRLRSALIMITLIPSVSGAYVIVERASFRRSETVDVVKLQRKYADHYTPEQMTKLVDVVDKNKLDSDSTGKQEDPFEQYTDPTMDVT